MGFDFPSYIRLLEDNLIENTGQWKSAYFFLRPLCDMTRCDVSEPKVSRWINGKCAIDENLRNAAGREEGIENTINHFRNEVINDINPNMLNKVAADLKSVLENDKNVDDDSKKRLLGFYEQNDLGGFLGQCFLYVVSAHTKQAISVPLGDSKNDRHLICNTDYNPRGLLNAQKPINVDLPANEARLLSSENYDLTISSKDDKHAFVVFASVKTDGIPSYINSFVEYMNELCFRGTSDQIGLSSIRVEDHKGNVLIEERDPIYMGKSMPAPPIRIRHFNHNLKGIINSKILITPPLNLIDLEICDQSGEIIRDMRTYRIERARNKKTCIARFIDDQDENVYFQFVFKAPFKFGKKDVFHISLNIEVKKPEDSRCNLTFYRVMKMLNESEKLCIWRKKDTGREKFFDCPGIHDPKLEENKVYNDMIDIFQKILFVEQGFGVSFDVTDFNNSNIQSILQMHKLLTEGAVSLGQRDFDLPDEYYDSYVEYSSEPVDGYTLFVTPVSDLMIFGKKVDVDPCYKIAVWAKEITVTDNKHLILKAEKSILYNTENSKVDESQILGEAM